MSPPTVPLSVYLRGVSAQVWSVSAVRDWQLRGLPTLREWTLPTSEKADWKPAPAARSFPVMSKWRLDNLKDIATSCVTFTIKVLWQHTCCTVFNIEPELKYTNTEAVYIYSTIHVLKYNFEILVLYLSIAILCYCMLQLYYISERVIDFFTPLHFVWILLHRLPTFYQCRIHDQPVTYDTLLQKKLPNSNVVKICSTSTEILLQQ